MTYLVVGLIIVAGLVVYIIFSIRMTKTNEKKAEDNSQLTGTSSTDTSGNAYEGLRSMALTASASKLGISVPSDHAVVYGIVMDWNMGQGIATLVSYQTGDASLYLSSGGGVIGGGQHPAVSSATKHFVALAQGYFNKASKVESTPLPGADEICFYLLTSEGTYAGHEGMKNFENGSSQWLDLFNDANNVMTALRHTTEK